MYKTTSKKPLKNQLIVRVVIASLRSNPHFMNKTGDCRTAFAMTFSFFKSFSKILPTGLILLLVLGLFNSVKAQSATDVLRYSLQYPSYDPVTMVMPGVAYATGFGAYQENPAVMALFDESYFSAGLSDLYVTEQGTYLNNTSTFDQNSLNISHAGLLYKFPTSQGSLVVGGGYSLTRGFSRAFSGSGFNEVTTITDFYASLPTTDPLNEAAYSAFAIIDPVGADESKSILRFANDDFLGITQNFEVTEVGSMGEYSAFIATELFKNLTIGISIGAIAGNYEYERTFLEMDERNLYSGPNVDIDDDGDFDTDVDQILSKSSIKESFTGFTARVGLVYKLSQHFNIGASYQFQNVLFIERTTDAMITTTFDNGVSYEGDISPGYKYNYEITRPARANLGIALTDINGFTFSAMAEQVDYSSASIEFDELNASSDEQLINQTIENELKEVYNLRFGLQYAFKDYFSARAGFGYYPSPVEEENFAAGTNPDRKIYSAGLSTTVSYNTTLNIGVQYATWEDETTLYSTPFGNEVVEEQITRWNIMAGITYYFD